jgi:type I restriction enzyme S subunit
MSEVNGDQPSGWVKTTLSEVTSVSRAKAEPGNFGDVSYIGLEHIEGVRNRILSVGMVEDVKSTKSVFQRGDVLYGKLRPYLKKVCRPDFDGVCSTDILVFSESPNLDNGYLLYFLSQDSTADYATQNSNGINLPRISSRALGEIEFPLPPLAEQRRIVAKIEAVQERSRRAREALSEMRPLLEQFRQSVLVAAFRGDLTADWRAAHPNVESASELLHRIRTERRRHWEQAELAKYKAKGQKPPKHWQDKYEAPELVDDSALSELPEGWCWAGLEELKALSPNSMTDGPFGSKLKTSHYSSSGIRVVRLGNIGVGHFNADDEVFISQLRYEELRKHEIFAGDLVIAALAEPVGRCCKIPPSIGKAIVKADCIRFRPHPSMLSEIVMHWLNSGTGRRLAEIASHGIGRLRINMENLRSLPVALPPVDEQIEIVASISAQLVGIARIEEQISSYNEDLDQLDHSILTKACRGELVPQDPNDEPASALLARIRDQRAQ